MMTRFVGSLVFISTFFAACGTRDYPAKEDAAKKEASTATGSPTTSSGTSNSGAPSQSGAATPKDESPSQKAKLTLGAVMAMQRAPMALAWQHKVPIALAATGVGAAIIGWKVRGRLSFLIPKKYRKAKVKAVAHGDHDPHGPSDPHGPTDDGHGPSGATPDDHSTEADSNPAREVAPAGAQPPYLLSRWQHMRLSCRHALRVIIGS